MPRVIFICPYLKGNGRTAARRRNYVKYIATREGTEPTGDSKKLLPATWRQKKLIGDILKDFPDTSERFEYEDCLEKPTRENASAFITAAPEQNLPFLGQARKLCGLHRPPSPRRARGHPRSVRRRGRTHRAGSGGEGGGGAPRKYMDAHYIPAA
jgi:hypothetical protein